MIWPLLLDVIALTPLLTLVGIVFWKRRQLDSDERRDPLCDELHLLPGQSAQQRIEQLAEARIDRLVFVITSSLIAAMVIAARRIGVETRPWDWFDSVICLISLGNAIFFGLRLTRDLPLQRKYRQGMRAEQATAQLIGASLAGDNRIIHDVQCGEFNIDHVAITPGGIFAIETKSRLKPPVGNGSPRVKYDGKTLDFGAWKEDKPIDQANRQARWLANYLRKETGETYAATAVVSLPGWYVERTARISPEMVQVINPKNSRWLLLPEKKIPVLDSPKIQRAANAVEKLARAKSE